ncbi:RNA polymerase sigma factor [Clostridium manihotivorum]|uniref:Uncharacterized protein n=1 Tax=Clostridium manihotivorum TaxID=2320868 RepID=A0A3R5TIP4_9CLOT|nr:RNA polymerase sigma factor [Clostridium manihotivorum]QAA34402.1 hypothetical protein C1I91_23710 [Clostridium manihotivorum]
MILNNSIDYESIDYYKEFMPMYLKCNKKLYITALFMLKNSHDAEDAVQDTLIAAIKGFNKLRDKESFEPWILKILVNRCKRLKFLRFKDVFTETIIGENFNFENYLLDSITIKAAILRLPYKYRVVIMLRYFNDLTIEQISDILSIPEGTIKSQLHRGINKLKDMLKGGIYNE